MTAPTPRAIAEFRRPGRLQSNAARWFLLVLCFDRLTMSEKIRLCNLPGLGPGWKLPWLSSVTQRSECCSTLIIPIARRKVEDKAIREC